MISRYNRNDNGDNNDDNNNDIHTAYIRFQLGSLCNGGGSRFDGKARIGRSMSKDTAYCKHTCFFFLENTIFTRDLRVEHFRTAKPR